MVKLECTTLTEEEFTLIPPHLLLKIFDVSSYKIWKKLPPQYQRRRDFKEQTCCKRRYYLNNSTPSNTKEECTICLQNFLSVFEREVEGEGEANEKGFKHTIASLSSQSFFVPSRE